MLRTIIDSYERQTGKGLPLGNVTSQLFANVYLHELDRFVKHDLHELYYLRYCDDFIIVHDSRAHLLGLVAKLRSFLEQELLLTLHPNKISVRSWGQGIDFVGYVQLPHATVVRTVTVKRALCEVVKENLASYMGLCRHATSFELRQLLRTVAGKVQ